MNKDAVILIAEDDPGHVELVKRNLWRSCVDNDILPFKDGQEILDFLFKRDDKAKRDEKAFYLLLLDIRMPKVDGLEVLRQIKEDEELRKIPVIILTTTDETSEINRFYEMGCSFYMIKPADYTKFMEAVENLGTFLSLEWVKVPLVDGVGAC
ncbi:MAG: response regulator [Phycisphaerae bacterium]|nr:response regulator [Phycisphaerae bacterium]